MNQNIKIAYKFHEITKHSPISVYLNSHYMDWENKPFPFKLYLNKQKINLPTSFPYPNKNSIMCLKQRIINSNSNLTEQQQIDLNTLTQILFFSAGITRKINFNNNTYYMRAASATGALYPIEIYLICQKIQKLDAGVYHFCPANFTLTQIRKGDFRSILFSATGNNKRVIQSPITIIFTSIAWRNSWKYQTRSYRHWFWDAGVILANFLALCNNNCFSSQIIQGYQDELINRLLGLKNQKEATIALATIDSEYTYNETNLFDQIKLSTLKCETKSISKHGETIYPEIWKIHESSYLNNVEEIINWVSSMSNKENLNSYNNKKNYDESTLNSKYNLGDLILHRGSTRRFSKNSITLTQLQDILYLASINIPFDFITDKQSLIEIYFIANSVTNLQAGKYYYNRLENKIEELEKGCSREIAGHLCLDQKLFSDASVVFFLLTNLDIILKKLGNRGYRSVQLEGGICAGKIYLTAYSQGLGASGSTFYDDEVIESFLPHSNQKSTIIAIGVGIPAYVSRPGKIFTNVLYKEDNSNKSL
ncbi:MAG: SagB/ThcOx family dehydrogenase [Nitrososphaeraceae archaeon]